MNFFKLFLPILLVLINFTSALGQKKTQDKLSGKDLQTFRSYESQTRDINHSDLDSLLLNLSRGLMVARNIKYPAGQAVMLDRFARVNEAHDNIGLALKYQQEAFRIADQASDPKMMAGIGTSLGVLQAKAGNLQQGQHTLINALAIFQKIKSLSGRQQVYVKLGDIHCFHHKYGTAIKYYRLAEKIFAAQDSTSTYLELQKKMGSTYAAEHDYDEALEHLERGLKRSSLLRDPQTRTELVLSMARVLDTLGQKQKSIAYQKQELQAIRVSPGNARQQAQLLVSLAKTVQNEDAMQGVMHLQNALAIANSTGNKMLSAEIYNSLHILYNQNAQYQQALAALRAYHHLSDSLLRANKGHQLVVLQRSFQLLESKARSEGLQIENEKRTSERNLYLFLAVFVVFLLVMAGLYLYKVKDLNRKLSASNLVKDKLFSIIGHDLRNPVGGITQMLELIENEDLDPSEQKVMITEMRKQGEAALDILGSLLQWGRAQLKGIDVKVSDFKPAGLIDKNLDALGRQISDKSLTVLNKVSSGQLVSGDQDHFDFIVRNLISNAIKFSHRHGMIEISSDSNSQPQKVVFAVKDHGKGISIEQQKKFLTDTLDIAYGTNGEKGTGIGLTLSKEFIKANHGKLWLESTEGNGATFYFSYPQPAT